MDNQPPKIINLISDKTSPQNAGMLITWTIDAIDPNGDQVLYRFFLNDEPVTGWTIENSWIWTAPVAGSYRVEAQVRDGKHSGPTGMDDRCLANFEISRVNNLPANRPPLINDVLVEAPPIREEKWLSHLMQQTKTVTLSITNSG